MAVERGIDLADGVPRSTDHGRVLPWPPSKASVTLWRQLLERIPKSDEEHADAERPPHEAAVNALWDRLPKLRPGQIDLELEAADPPVRRAVLARLEEQLELEAGDAGTSLFDLVCEARGLPRNEPPHPFPVFGPGDVSRVHQLLQQRRQGVSQDAYV